LTGVPPAIADVAMTLIAAATSAAKNSSRIFMRLPL
jgi:hypothetical protein